MKKLLFIIIILAVLLPFSYTPKLTSAQNYSYSRILDEHTEFFSDKDGKNFKFYLPYSYYVKVIKEGAQYSLVGFGYEDGLYPFLTGYVKTVDLNVVQDTPTYPYPKSIICANCDGVIFKDTNLYYPITAVYQTTDVYMYGTSFTEDGEEVYYVYGCGYFGYVKKEVFPDFELKPHPDPIVEETIGSADFSDSLEFATNGCNDNFNVQIVIIAGISVVAISLVYLLFRPADTRSTAISEEDE